MRAKTKSSVIGALVLSALCAGPVVSGGPVGAATKTVTKMQGVAAQTSASKTMEFGMNMTMTMSAGGKTIVASLAGSGTFDRVHRASAFNLDIYDFMKAIAAGSGAPLPAQMSDRNQFKMSVISIGNKVWISYPLLNSLAAGTAANKPWVILDATQTGVDAGDLAASQGADPTQGLDFLSGLSEAAKPVGSEMVDGVKTTKYLGSVTVDALTKNLPKSQSADVTKMMGSDTSIPVVVWVDEQNRARKFEMTTHMTQQAMGVTMKITYTFAKFDEPVSISPPPASQVGENKVLANMLAQAAKAKKKAA